MVHEMRCKVLQSGWMVRAAALALLTVALAGCPSGPSLLVSPGALDFDTSAERMSFTIVNSGSGVINWTVEEVVWQGVILGWVAQDVSWLTVDAEDTAGQAATEIDRVFLNVDRTGLAAGTYTSTGVRIVSDGGSTVIPVSMTVSGSTVEPGEGDLTISPTTLTLSGLSDTATFTATNEGDTIINWYATVSINDASADDDAEVQVAVTPTMAATAAGYSTLVTVYIPEPTDFDTSVLNYVVDIYDSSTNVLIDEVNVSVELVAAPAVSVDPALLDFGEDSYQLDFYVANTGDPLSSLDFGFFEKTDNDTYVPYDVEADELIVSITAPDGTENVKGDDDDPWLNQRQVTVIISRDAIEDDLEYREVYVGAVTGTDGNGDPVMDTDIEPALLNVRVAAAAFVEGAINRSRPPSIMRFVFMLRDKRGVAVDASNETIRDQIEFAIEEDGNPLDPDESSIFITGPEHLTCNMVVLLDFTGSMYRAAVNDETNPLQPGEAIDQMKQAAAQFILDLPSSYRVAIMEYHDRNQATRVIHSFDTNKSALLEDLQAFDLPEAEHGASALYDALYDASQRLAAEDSGVVLPFDEADVRAVVVVTDGWDTSSINTLTEVIDFAKDNRVRFYPLGFSGRTTNPVNTASLIQLVAETGGHNYYASEVTDLARQLDTDKSLTFADTIIDPDAKTATLSIRNIGSTAFAWSAVESLDWLYVSPATSTVPALSRADDGTITESGVRQTVIHVASGLAAGTYSGVITINSLGGNATVGVEATVFPGGDISTLSVSPRTNDLGNIWNEFQGQVVLTYTSLLQEGTHTYNITSTFPDSTGETTSAEFEKDGVFYSGDTRAGQISLATSGIQDGAAEVFVRTSYVPRNISEFRFRFIINVPDALTPALTPAERVALRDTLAAQIEADAVELAPDGLLTGWRVIQEGHGVFTLVSPEDYLTYGAFGNLLRLTFTGLGANDAFTVGFRVDNERYYVPTLSKYFLYPGGILNPTRVLNVSALSDIASPVASLTDFATAIDPEDVGTWDRDDDSWADFDDSYPDDTNLGDADDDGTPDLEDSAPDDPLVS